MKKLLEIQKRFTPAIDKLEHFFWGFWYTLLGVALYLITGWSYLVVVPPVLLGLRKEFWDLGGNGTPDFKDLLATAVPGIVIQILILIIK